MLPVACRRCIHLIAELGLTSNQSAASRRDAPDSTASTTRSRNSKEHGFGIDPPSKTRINARQIQLSKPAGESRFNSAEIRSKFRGRTTAFSWPSKAGLFDYAYDRDSAVFSRDDFEHLLSSIVSAPGASRVHIIAHSMGTMLALESLRQLYARYGDTVTGRIGAVVFAAPDIDMDVFSSAIGRIGPLAGKITVVTSTNDRALALSGRIAGGMTRVGAAEKAAIERLGVRVIDASDAGWGIINHDLFLWNAEVLKVIRRSIDTAAA
jgi:esterase/lipase superfamily enzyme